MPGGDVPPMRAPSGQNFALACVKSVHRDRPVFSIFRTPRSDDGEKNCLSAWEELWPAVGALSFLQGGQRLNRASSGGNLKESPLILPEHDHVIGSPGPAAGVPSAGQPQGGSAANGDLLQRAFSK